MEIKHRVCISPKHDTKAYKKLIKMGIETKNAGGGKIVNLYYFEIFESDVLWPEVEKLIISNKIPTRPETIFTKKEIQSSQWVAIRPEFIRGYPMPDLDGSWREVSFNAGQECPECGIGREQLAPIHLKGEPKLGKNDFMGIFWTLNIFAKPEVIAKMSENTLTGYDVLPAIHHKTGKELATIKQLKFTKEFSDGLIDDNLKKEFPKCSHVKYLGVTRDIYKFRKDSLSDMPDFVKTSQWFGSAHTALHVILASSAFVDLYMENKWKGLHLEPIELI